MKTALVLGGGGFIGSHLVRRLKSEGYWVRAVDLKRPEFSESEADEFLIYDLRDQRNVDAVIRLFHYGSVPQGFTYSPPAFGIPISFDEVYQLAADMGGAGYIFTGEHDADVMHNSATINLNVANTCYKTGFTGKLFYSSSACMYPAYNQEDPDNPKCSEDSAYPAAPDSEYGWEKLFSERLYLAFLRNHGLNIRIARFHNIYGPEGTYKGGREKAPAAMCRKVYESKGKIEVWGDGTQTRSFLFIDDCIDAVRLLMQSDFQHPINIGSEEMVSINLLAAIVCEISGQYIKVVNVEGPVGVKGRNSDNALIERVLGWKPKYSLREGLEKTYQWLVTEYERSREKVGT